MKKKDRIYIGVINSNAQDESVRPFYKHAQDFPLHMITVGVISTE